MSSILKALQRLQGERAGAGEQPALRDDLAREVTAHRAEPAAAAPPHEEPSAPRWRALLVAGGLALVAMAVAGFFAARTFGPAPAPVVLAPPPAPAAPAEPDPAAPPMEGEPRVRRAAPARPSAPPEEAPTLPASIVAPSEAAPAEPEEELAAAEAEASGELAPAPAAATPPAPPPSVAAAEPPVPATQSGVPTAAPPAPRATPSPSSAERAAPAAAAPAPARVETPHIELAQPGAPPAGFEAPTPPAAAAPAPSAFDPWSPSERADEPAAVVLAPAPRQREPDFAVVTPPPELTVLRTSWHPRPERRVARIRLAGTSAPVEVHEGDALSTLVVKRIEPSGVVFLHGGRELRRGVGGE